MVIRLHIPSGAQTSNRALMTISLIVILAVAVYFPKGRNLHSAWKNRRGRKSRSQRDRWFAGSFSAINTRLDCLMAWETPLRVDVGDVNNVSVVQRIITNFSHAVQIFVLVHKNTLIFSDSLVRVPGSKHAREEKHPPDTPPCARGVEFDRFTGDRNIGRKGAGTDGQHGIEITKMGGGHSSAGLRNQGRHIVKRPGAAGAGVIVGDVKQKTDSIDGARVSKIRGFQVSGAGLFILGPLHFLQDISSLNLGTGILDNLNGNFLDLPWSQHGPGVFDGSLNHF